MEVDPAADFLAREQSALGDLESEIVSNSGCTALPSFPTFGDAFSNNDLISAGASCGLESSTGSFEMIGGEISEPVYITGSQASRVEAEKIRKWREEQKQRLEEKDREELEKKEELRVQAKKELEDWLRQTEESIAKTKTASRNAEKQSASIENCDPLESASEWERIAKLCDFNPKVNKSGKDVSRMRSIYLHLKQSPIPMQKAN